MAAGGAVQEEVPALRPQGAPGEGHRALPARRQDGVLARGAPRHDPAGMVKKVGHRLRDHAYLLLLVPGETSHAT